MHRADFQVVVIADDLTGANDTGVQIAKRGLEAVTVVDPSLVAETRADGIVVDTESRTLPADEARDAVRRAARALGSPPNGLLYKKIDSTLRGHIGAELDALVGEFAPDRVVCTPAYPKNGRTTRGGVHFLHGVPIDRTEMAADLRNPVDTASVPAVLAKEGGPRFRHVGLDILRSGRAVDLPADRFLSFDCEEQEDLARIVRLLGDARSRILWCGSAGLAEVLLESRFPSGTGSAARADDGERAPAARAAGETSRADPVLSVIGSRSGVTRRQFATALSLESPPVVRLNPDALADSAARERARIVSELEAQAENAGHVILTSLEAASGQRPIAGSPQALDALSERVARGLADAAAAFLGRRRVAGLFLTGGDIAFHVIRAVGARGLRLTRELEAGIPAARLIGGALDGLPVVTKSGAFGDEQTLVRSARYLAAQPREDA